MPLTSHVQPGCVAGSTAMSRHFGCRWGGEPGAFGRGQWPRFSHWFDGAPGRTCTPAKATDLSLPHLTVFSWNYGAFLCNAVNWRSCRQPAFWERLIRPPRR